MKTTLLRFATTLAIAMSMLWSLSAQQVLTLDLNQPTNPTEFSLDADRVWTETYSNDYPYIEFNNSTFLFSHVIDFDAYGYWDGFTYSQNADNTNYGKNGSANWIAHQFGNMAGGGVKTDAEGNVLKDGNGAVVADPDAPYLLAYWGYYKQLFGMSENQTLHVILDKPYQAHSVYVNNSPWTYYGNLYGDGFARALDQDGDYFKLFIHGLDENYEDNGLTVEHYLAKNEGGGIENLQQSPDWEWVDLSPLGEVGGFYFTMESTDEFEGYGPNTAVYFSLDKLQVIDNSVTIPTKINDLTAEISVYPNPFAESIIVNTTSEGKVTVYDLSGRVVLSATVQAGENKINTSTLNKGVYILKQGLNTVKIVK